MYNPKTHTILQKLLQSLALLVVSIGYTQPATTNQQLLYISNASSFYAAEGSLSVKGLTIITSENANTNVLTLFSSAPPHDVENQSLTSDLQASTRLKTSLPKPQKHNQKTTSKTTEVEKPIAKKTVITCPFGTTSNNGSSFMALNNVAISSPPTSLQRRGVVHTSIAIKEFYTILNNGISESNQSVVFDTTLQVNTSKYIGQITTRPPPFSTT